MAAKESKADPITAAPNAGTEAEASKEVVINASGHVQELSRGFSLLSLAGVGLVVGNVWPAIGGTILVAIANGGPPGVCNCPVETLALNCQDCD
jgi:hypothetical protein